MCYVLLTFMFPSGLGFIMWSGHSHKSINRFFCYENRTIRIIHYYSCIGFSHLTGEKQLLSPVYLSAHTESADNKERSCPVVPTVMLRKLESTDELQYVDTYCHYEKKDVNWVVCAFAYCWAPMNARRDLVPACSCITHLNSKTKKELIAMEQPFHLLQLYKLFYGLVKRAENSSHLTAIQTSVLWKMVDKKAKWRGISHIKCWNHMKSERHFNK